MSADETARPRLDEIEKRYSDEAVQVGQVWRAYSDVPVLTAALRDVMAVHERVYRVFSWAHGGTTDYPPCSTCDGAPGVHECGCWADEQIEYVCAACDAPKRRTTWPCGTVRAITAHIDLTDPAGDPR